MTDPNGNRAEKTAQVIRNALDGVMIARFCANRSCPSYGRKREGLGRYLGQSEIGAAANILCPDCGRVTEIRPVITETIAVGKKLAKAT